MASVASGDGARDDHLRSADLFDVETHPEARFRSTGVTRDGTAGRLGDLTIKGATRPVTLEVDCLGQVRDPWGNERIVFSASGRVNRDDRDITWNPVPETGGRHGTVCSPSRDDVSTGRTGGPPSVTPRTGEDRRPREDTCAYGRPPPSSPPPWRP